MPWLGSRYDTFLATQIAIYALFAVSLNLLLGTTGLVSFGHAAYFGVGAYVCGILMKTYGVPFLVAFPAAGDRRRPFALVFGFFCVRLTKIYFAMLTLAFSQIVWAICFKWNDVTGGDQGLPDMPYPDLDWMASMPGFGDLRIGDSSIFCAGAGRGLPRGAAPDRALAVRPGADDDPRQPGARRLYRRQRARLRARRLRRSPAVLPGLPARCSASSTAASSPISCSGRNRPR